MNEQVRTLQEEGWTLLRTTETGKAVMQAPDSWSSGGYTIHVLVNEKGSIINRYTSHHVPSRVMEPTIMDHETIYHEAYEAGRAAAFAHKPTPMVVQQRMNPLNDNSPVVHQYDSIMDGICGFAYVRIKGNTSFGRWAKKQGLARTAYPSGLQIWIGEYNQSYELKMAHATAMAKYLNQNGIEAYADGRVD